MRQISNTFFVADNDCEKCKYIEQDYGCGMSCSLFEKAVNHTPLDICKQSTIRETKIEEPKRCFVKLGRDQFYPIVKIHYDTKQVTVQEREHPNVYNTLSFDDVDFDLDTMSYQGKFKFLDKLEGNNK